MKAFTGDGLLTDAQHLDYLNRLVDREAGREEDRKVQAQADTEAQAQANREKFEADWRGFYEKIEGIIPEALIPFPVLPDYTDSLPYLFVVTNKEQVLSFEVPGYETLKWRLAFDGQYYHPMQWEVNRLALVLDEEAGRYEVVSNPRDWKAIPDDNTDSAWAQAMLYARELHQVTRVRMQAEADAKTEQMRDRVKVTPMPAALNGGFGTLTDAELRLVQALRDLRDEPREIPF